MTGARRRSGGAPYKGEQLPSQKGYEITGDSESVEIWLATRLPLAPGGALLEAKNELRAHLRKLVSGPGTMLSAVYTSQDDYRFDVENVLIYNVGSSALAQASRKGLEFRRSRAKTPLSPSGRSYPHHHRYSLEPVSVDLAAGESVCSFAFDLRRLNTTSKPHDVWWPAVRASATQSSELRLSGAFALQVSLQVPDSPRNLAGLVKPILDGVIASLHTESVLDAVAVERLSVALGADPGAVEDALRSPNHPVLGEIDLVQSYRDFIKWNPADDLCEHCRVLVEEWPREKFGCSVVVQRL